jgi:hypothetical protein
MDMTHTATYDHVIGDYEEATKQYEDYESQPREERKWSTSNQLSRRANAAGETVYAAFGEINGWYRADSQAFRPQDIGRQIGNSWFDGRGQRGGGGYHEQIYHDLFDHGLWYRQKLGGRRWRNIAIVGQPYGILADKEKILDTACKHYAAGGVLLKWHMPPNPRASIHFPGSTIFLVLTLPGIEIKWLPEQMEVKQ